jgi:hypothetical protein
LSVLFSVLGLGTATVTQANSIHPALNDRTENPSFSTALSEKSANHVASTNASLALNNTGYTLSVLPSGGASLNASAWRRVLMNSSETAVTQTVSVNRRGHHGGNSPAAIAVVAQGSVPDSGMSLWLLACAAAVLLMSHRRGIWKTSVS